MNNSQLPLTKKSSTQISKWRQGRKISKILNFDSSFSKWPKIQIALCCTKPLKFGFHWDLVLKEQLKITLCWSVKKIFSVRDHFMNECINTWDTGLLYWTPWSTWFVKGAWPDHLFVFWPPDLILPQLFWDFDDRWLIFFSFTSWKFEVPNCVFTKK